MVTGKISIRTQPVVNATKDCSLFAGTRMSGGQSTEKMLGIEFNAHVWFLRRLIELALETGTCKTVHP